MNDIHFNKGRYTTSLTRNGTTTTAGLSFYKDLRNNCTEIYPITSKGNNARGHLTIPNEHWVGNAVEKLLERKELLPLLVGIHPLLDSLISEKLKE